MPFVGTARGVSLSEGAAHSRDTKSGGAYTLPKKVKWGMRPQTGARILNGLNHETHHEIHMSKTNTTARKNQTLHEVSDVEYEKRRIIIEIPTDNKLLRINIPDPHNKSLQIKNQQPLSPTSRRLESISHGWHARVFPSGT